MELHRLRREQENDAGVIEEAQRDARRQSATIAQLRQERDVYKLASETAIYEAQQFDRALFLSGDRGVEDVMRRVLDALKQAQQELKIAHSRAIRAEAQAATIAAERDGMKEDALALAMAVEHIFTPFTIESMSGFLVDKDDYKNLQRVWSKHGARYLEAK